MKFSIVTLFPGFFASPLGEGLLGKAIEAGLVEIETVDLRRFGEGKHKSTDDYPFGGGAGMVMKAAPVVSAIEEAREKEPGTRVVLMTPQGRPLTTKVAKDLAGQESVTLVCGRYEGFDERIREFADDEISVGDFVLMGGETASLAVVEASVRFVPGVLGDMASTEEESMSEGLLEYPHYTRPRSFRGMEVPEVLLGGNHAEIEKWRREQAIERTALKRPDLLDDADLTEEEAARARSMVKGGA